MVHLTILHFPVTGKITIPVKLVSISCVAEIYTLLQTSRKMGRTKLCHHPPRPTIHHHPLPAKIHPPLPTTSQKMDHHPAKAKIYSYVTSFWHYFKQFFFLRNAILLSVKEILSDKVLISSLFKFQISTSIQKQPPEVFCKNRCS